MSSNKNLVHGQTLQAPNSSGSRPPKTPLPLGATDCHHHLFSPAFPKKSGTMVARAEVEDYLLFKKRLGISRSVIVAPSSYGTDNGALLDALGRLGTDVARGVAIVDPEISDGELDALHEAGVRGLRYYFMKGKGVTPDELRKMACRAADRGWHVQMVGERNKEVLVDWEDVLKQLAAPVVIDHFGYAPQPEGERSATMDVIRRLLDTGNAYVKLSAVYIQSKAGYPNYADVNEMAIELVSQAPDRMLWGTDWPHTGAVGQKPDGAALVEQLSLWAPDDQIRQKILVDNPSQLYWCI
ncbi:amidohydrolase family protein [Candidimonas nitroreducens]|nr:amidohydrolase family protein [Candidimonas nitroreducens]